MSSSSFCLCLPICMTCWALSSAEALVHFQLLALSKATLLIGCLGALLHLERWKARVSPSRNKPQGLLSCSRPLSGPFVAQSIPFSTGVCHLALEKIKFPPPDLTSPTQVSLRNSRKVILRIWNVKSGRALRDHFANPFHLKAHITSCALFPYSQESPRLPHNKNQEQVKSQVNQGSKLLWAPAVFTKNWVIRNAALVLGFVYSGFSSRTKRRICGGSTPKLFMGWGVAGKGLISFNSGWGVLKVLL